MAALPSRMAGTRRRLAVNDAELELYEGGEGPPLLALHGFLESPGWTECHGLLAERYRVLAPSHPGFAGSSRPTWLQTVDDLAYFYLDVVEALGLQQHHLLGHSLGGWIAAEMAVRCSHGLEKLVLVDAVGLRTLPTPVGPAGGSIADWLVLEPAALRSLAWREPATANTLKLPGDPGLTEEELVGVLRNRETASLYGWKPFFYNPQLDHWLHRVKASTLVVWGEHDGVVPLSVGEAYARAIPDARLEILPATAHLPHLEQPRAFADAVLGFLG
jgi:pimeloyl-ACP methyl ester carboxylesterase